MNERVYVKSIYINVYIGCNIYPIPVQNTPNPSAIYTYPRCKIHPIYTTPGAIYTQPDARWTEYGDVCHKIWH